MQICTTRFGSVTIDESQIVTFSEGLPGFETTRRFVFLPHPGDVSRQPVRSSGCNAWTTRPAPTRWLCQ